MRYVSVTGAQLVNAIERAFGAGQQAGNRSEKRE
jgi:hypothetical protein